MYRIDLKGRRKRKNFYSKAIILAFLIVVFILGRATFGVFVKNKETKENLFEARADLDDLREREAGLEEEINKLNTAKGIDEEIKTKFRVVKEGEEMIILIDSPETSGTSSAENEKGLWDRILDLF